MTTPTASTISFTPGALMIHKEREVIFTELLTLTRGLVIDSETNEHIHVEIDDLRMAPIAAANKDDDYLPEKDIQDYSDEEWAEAQKRFEVIRPILLVATGRTAAVEKAAKDSEYSRSTIYKMLSVYDLSGSVAALIPKKRGRKKNTILLDHKQDAIIEEMLDKHHFSTKRLSIRRTWEKALYEATIRGLGSFSLDAVQRRANRRCPEAKMRAQHGRNKAKDKYKSIETGVPNAEKALELVQIDHTLCNVILVDELERKPIGRPWVTITIDVKTRVILSIYISFDYPSAVSVGAVLGAMMQPKSEYLASLGFDKEIEWPTRGIPKMVHSDGAPEFVSKENKRAAGDIGFQLEYRHKDGTNFGGHIERMMGTFSAWLKELPGRTFSNPKERGDYDSEAEASLTLLEFEKFVVRHICEVYHKKPHAGLGNGLAPLRAWEQQIFGNEASGEMGIGLPPAPANPDVARIKLLPTFRRMITRSGVTFKGIPYQDEHLYRLRLSVVNEKNENDRKFSFHYDPRDITSVWIWDTDSRSYVHISIALRGTAPMSLGEYRGYKKRLKARNEPYDLAAIARHDAENERLIEESIKTTKEQRKKAESRRTNGQRKSAKSQMQDKGLVPDKPKSSLGAFAGFDTSKISAFNQDEQL